MSKLSDRDAAFAAAQEEFAYTNAYVNALKNPLTQGSIETAPKVVISLLGLPGAGKSTQLANIEEITGAKVFHMGKFARAQATDQAQDEGQRKSGKLLSGYDEAFLATALSDKSRYIILDGYPRSADQAKLVAEAMEMTGATYSALRLNLGENEVEESFRRQVRRDERLGKKPDVDRYLGKIERAIDQDLSAIATLRQLGVAVHDIDATQPSEKVFEQVKEELGLDLRNLPYDRDKLTKLKEVADALGVEAWASSGAVQGCSVLNIYAIT